MDCLALFEAPSGLTISADRPASRSQRQPPRRRAGVRRSLTTASAAGSSTSSSRARKSKASAAAGGAVAATMTPARCGYRTGKCQNLQAVKRNGKLHKLCEFHREKANMNQKKLDRKKRLQRSSSRLPYDALDAMEQSGSGGNRRRAHPGAKEEQSPRAIDVDPLLEAMLQEDDDLQLEVLPVLPTSLHEAPLSLGYEELAIFCSLMTMDRRQQAPYQLPFQQQFIV